MNPTSSTGGWFWCHQCDNIVPVLHSNGLTARFGDAAVVRAGNIGDGGRTCPVCSSDCLEEHQIENGLIEDSVSNTEWLQYSFEAQGQNRAGGIFHDALNGDEEADNDDDGTFATCTDEIERIDLRLGGLTIGMPEACVDPAISAIQEAEASNLEEEVKDDATVAAVLQEVENEDAEAATDAMVLALLQGAEYEHSIPEGSADNDAAICRILQEIEDEEYAAEGVSDSAVAAFLAEEQVSGDTDSSNVWRDASSSRSSSREHPPLTSDPGSSRSCSSSRNTPGGVSVAVARERISCAVCLERLRRGEETTFLPCNHGFHSACIGRWLELKRKCPVCRVHVPRDDPSAVRSAHVWKHTIPW